MDSKTRRFLLPYLKISTCLFVYLRVTTQSWKSSHDTWDETALIRQLSPYLAPKALVKIPRKYHLLSCHRNISVTLIKHKRIIKHFLKDIFILEETIYM